MPNMSLRKLMLVAALATSIVCGPSLAADVSGLPDFTRIVAAEGPAVVNINTSRIERTTSPGVPDALANDPFFEFFRRFAPPQSRERQVGSLGSGFIISPDGYVLTNTHVVAGAEQIAVTLTDKREFKARLVGADERTDVALLKIDGSNLPVVRLGKSSQLQVGQWVLAIGSPFGFDNSVTAGIVSALGRELPDETLVPFIQTDAAVNPGNSGGPLFNMNGEVVGINSQILSRSGGYMGISFAIPIDVALGISEELKAHGKVQRARIGVTMQPLTKELAQSFGLTRNDGALVVDVERGGPADRGGLKVGDIVTRVNRQPISGYGELQRMVMTAKAGTRFVLDVWRNGASRQLTVVSEAMSAQKAPAPTPPASRSRPESRINQVGLAVSELSPAQRSQLGVPYGVLVRGVSAASARAGLAPGDVIIGIGGEPLTSLRQLETALRAGKGSVALQVVRNGNQMFIPVPLAAGDDE